MHVDQLGPIATAVGLGGFVIFATVHRHRRRGASDLVRRSLADRDPEMRRAGVFLAAQDGLAPYGRELVERSRAESDESVRDALAEVVLRNQWEPVDDASLVELRLWAHGHLGQADFAPPVSTVAHGNPATNGDSATNGNSAAHEDAPPAPRAPQVATRTMPRPATVGTRRQVAVVTGAGGPAGIAVIRALQAGGYRVIAVDLDGLAAGFRIAHDSALVPPADDASYVEAVCEVATSAGATIVVPTMTEELIPLYEARELLGDLGVAMWLPDPGAVEACMDKWRFAQVLAEHGVPSPATNLGSAEGVAGAWVVKPRYGRGSRDVLMIDRADELKWALRRVPQPIVQTRLTGREFTVDVLVDRDGTVAGAVPRWRLETRAGCSTKGRTFEHAALGDGITRLMAALGLQGPANVQGFIAADGAVSFVEVNPRFSGGLPLALAAGADLVGEYARAVCGEAIRPDRLAFRPGVTMIRRYEEVFE